MESFYFLGFRNARHGCKEQKSVKYCKIIVDA
jgi:hypothetical protein